MKCLLNLVALLFSVVLVAQEPVKKYTTTWANTPPEIDGILDDEVWSTVEWGGDFVQFQPEYGAAPEEQTQFKILYDAKFIYVGVRAFDSEPDEIVRRMSRRDGFEGDWVEINIDSYLDRRTAFSFTASVSGVKSDEYVTNNGDNWDETWDPIWYLETSIDDKGWIAEFKIPLSQLRFADKPEHTWGIELTRRNFRHQERSVWQPIPQDAPGWVHLFGELNGIKGIRPQKQLEIQPYIVAQTDRYKAESGNPYATGKDNVFNAGVDAKIGLTSDVTLDLTINPDFGQVEADPSQVNLSAFRLYFRERRPFFLEGNNILTFNIGDGNNLFYSRNIGARPSYYPDASDVEYVDQPDFTRILGAAKLTGKNKKGFSFGLIESVTNEEKATVMNVDGDERKVVVEPYTNYLAGRFQQDYDEGNTVIGAMLTSTNRWINDEHLDFLHNNAYSGGVDVRHNFNERKYYVSARTAFSHVEGSQDAILGTQTASERFFQRPNNFNKDVDSTRTTLTGTTSNFAIGKQSGNLIFRSNISYMSPELSLNDIGFLVQTDRISQENWMQWRKLEPFGVFRWFRFNINQWTGWDFDGVRTSLAGNVNAHAQFENLWSMGGGYTARAERVSNADLRGGPSITYPGGHSLWMYFETPDQKKLSMWLNPYYFTGNLDYAEEFGFWLGINWQPLNVLSFQLRPTFEASRNDLQYIETNSFQGEERYVLGSIDQVTYRMSFRSTFNVTPNLSLEYWGQPFVSSGEYSELKHTLTSYAENYGDRFHTYDAQQIFFNTESETYEIDENRDGTIDYEISDPDFNIMQFRQNFVMRWEYIPGSTFFVVWSINGSEFNNLNQNNLNDLTRELLNVDSRHTFLVKYTYRFIL